jgi:hypothetical protein
MNMSPSFTNIRSHLSHTFFTLRTDARRDSLWAKLMGKSTKLEIFPEEVPEKSPNRKFIGTEDIPVAQIAGTLSRYSDFDHKFRPLNKHLCERWINVYLAFESEGWSPILVHKVGEIYYVEDGHHRVSVAQELGMTFIQASIWEYPSLVNEPKQCQPEPCPERSSVQVYAEVTE